MAARVAIERKGEIRAVGRMRKLIFDQLGFGRERTVSGEFRLSLERGNEARVGKLGRVEAIGWQHRGEQRTELIPLFGRDGRAVGKSRSHLPKEIQPADSDVPGGWSWEVAMRLPVRDYRGAGFAAEAAPAFAGGGGAGL